MESSLSRRGALKLFGATALLLPFGVACSAAGVPREPALLRSAARLPKPYTVPLPIPDVLKPSTTDGQEDVYDLAVRAADAEILPGLTTAIWGYGGTFPGPTIATRRGRPVRLRLRNDLPVPVVNHLHGGRTPAESDGYPTDLVMPEGGGAHDHGHMADDRAVVTVGGRDYVYPNDQPAATLWYHDHRMDFTAPQLWRGLAGFHLIGDDVEDGLPLPSGERDIPLMICDRAFDADGGFRYPSLDPDLAEQPGVRTAYMGGVLGDVVLVNGAPWPELDVDAVRYRFRLLNASNARRYTLTLDPPPPDGPAFVQVGSDQGLLGAPYPRPSVPISPAERYDVVVDFSGYPVGTTVVLRDTEDTMAGGPATVMRFRVARSGTDDSSIPSTLADVPQLEASDATVTREFRFSLGTGDMPMWMVNGQPFDPARADASPKLGAVELWRLSTDVRHPVHLHLAPFQVVSRGGKRRADDVGWKDTVDIGQSQTVSIVARFDGYRGRYVFHCHNLEHEDMAMMANFEVV